MPKQKVIKILKKSELDDMATQILRRHKEDPISIAEGIAKRELTNEELLYLTRYFNISKPKESIWMGLATLFIVSLVLLELSGTKMLQFFSKNLCLLLEMTGASLVIAGITASILVFFAPNAIISKRYENIISAFNYELLKRKEKSE